MKEMLSNSSTSFIFSALVFIFSPTTPGPNWKDIYINITVISSCVCNFRNLTVNFKSLEIGAQGHHSLQKIKKMVTRKCYFADENLFLLFGSCITYSVNTVLHMDEDVHGLHGVYSRMRMHAHTIWVCTQTDMVRVDCQNLQLKKLPLSNSAWLL